MHNQHKHRLIYLTGFMASGKSTVGPILANCLGYYHVDLDAVIEGVMGKSVREIFLQEGEVAFRELEYAKLKEVSAYEGYVVSLGGGTVLQEKNLHLIKSTGFLIYLKTNPQQLFRRLKHKKDRPVLQSPTGESLSDQELRNRIESLLVSREATYGQADLVIPTDNKPIGKTVDEIVKLLRKVVE